MLLALLLALSGLAQAQVIARTVCGPGGPISPATAVSSGEQVNAQTGASYTYQNTDCGKLITHSNGSSIAGTLPQANSTTFRSGWFIDVQNIGAGTLTITPTTSTLDGAAALVFTTGQGARIVSNGINYYTERGGAGTTIPPSIPAGLITLTLTSCPAGWAEVSALDGFTVIGTLAAHGDVGSSGGADMITPTGTISAPTFTGGLVTSSATSAGTPAGTNSAPALTMNSYTPGGSNGTAAFTPTGTNSAPAFTGSAGTVPAETFTGSSGTVPAQTFTGSSATTSSVSAGTPAGTNASGAFSEGALSWPAGVPTNASGAFTEGAISWPAGVPTIAAGVFTQPTITGSTAAEASHKHDLPFQIPSTTTIRQIAVATFGTGTTQTATSVSAAGTANTTSAAVASSGPGSSHLHAVGTLANGSGAFAEGAISWPGGVPTSAAGSFTQPTVSWPVGVPTIAAGVFTQPTFSGNALSGHTHTLTATGTNGTASFTPAGTNGTAAFTPAGTVAAPTFTGNAGTVPAEAFTGNAATLTGSVAAPTFSGTALGTHTHTVTATGTNSAPTFTGDSFDNRSAFVRVIFCSKT